MAKGHKTAALASADGQPIRLHDVETGVCPQMAADVREYIGDMAAGLAELAYANRLEAVAVACEMVREIAEGNVSIDTRLVRLS